MSLAEAVEERSEAAAGAPPLTAIAIRARLQERYPLKDGWVTMAEVTPPKASRRFDLVAIHVWQSRGREVQGFEVKVSRADWLRELAAPAKAEPLVRLCTRWWIVAPPEVVRADEVPAGWGLLVVHPEQIRAVKQAPRLDAGEWTEAVWRCMLLRCATRERHEPDALAQARSDGWREGHAAGRASAEQEAARWERDHEALAAQVQEVEAAVGMSLRYLRNFSALGEAYRLVSGDGRQGEAQRLERQARDLRETALRMRAAARCLRQTSSPVVRAAEAVVAAGASVSTD